MTRRYTVTVVSVPMLAMFDARGREAGLAAGLAAAGLPFPACAGMRAVLPDGCSVLRAGPRRVVIMADIAMEAELGRALARGFAACPDADVTLVSDMFSVFDLTGPGAADVLAQGAPLDLSEAAVPAGRGIGTELWGTTVILIPIKGTETGFRIVVERSFAGYIEDWLAVASGSGPTRRPGVMASPPPSWQPS
jgi:sarcosine oxidase, subunit gamma